MSALVVVVGETGVVRVAGLARPVDEARVAAKVGWAAIGRSACVG